MSRKETLLREAARQAAEEKKRRGNRPPDEPYNIGSMDAERMPLGCWMWVIAAVIGVLYLFRRWFGI